MENDELLHKWVNGDLTAEESEAFKRRPEFAALKKIKDQTDRMAVPAFDDNAMLGNILAQDKQASAKIVGGKKRFAPNWARYAGAAIALLLLGFFFWPTQEMVSFQTAIGKQLEGQLPDGSTFLLNAESSLAYHPDDWKASRVLQLEGEAFFVVEKGKPFKVHTLNGEVEVLGTQFNVWSRKQTLEVKCQSGKVGVSTKEAPTRNELSANDAIRYTAGRLVEKWVEPNSNAASWNEGISKFRKVPLARVLAELERQFQVQIVADAVDAQEIISCNFAHNNLDLALKTCLSPLAITYQIQGNTVILTAPIE